MTKIVFQNNSKLIYSIYTQILMRSRSYHFQLKIINIYVLFIKFEDWKNIFYHWDHFIRLQKHPKVKEHSIKLLVRPLGFPVRTLRMPDHSCSYENCDISEKNDFSNLLSQICVGGNILDIEKFCLHVVYCM